MQDIEKDTIVKAAGGDMAAFEEIYRKTSAFVYNVARHITASAEDADEVTQDVFIKIYNNLGGFNFLSSLKTWIYRIAVNTALNHKKASGRHLNRRADYDITLKTAAAKEEAKDNLDSQAKKDKLRRLLDALSSEQRACIVLREIEGMDYKEIAAALKIKINTVRTRLKRARERLINLNKKG
ncbi:MAG: hypothetical protein COV72_01530 [Candidatus Omnitrophica bacterium CG11_big_fil_rev_8_21_14_0_20_42_13]|uniref:RNA polymerase sigma factor n=1 Tax=Candidatus Ghiorseimicrobium undicola TaxID=1974746 RepID=A0A2H0LZE8_9BACT|nr:MAG: hypothetical protein COV72_01530 [Candidatus Omnitrophica bacterium CG11_big_fil_rev_8_21_14_0_20_42_13]